MRGSPTTVIINRGGRIRHHGFGQDDDLALGLRLGALLAEPKPRSLDRGNGKFCHWSLPCAGDKSVISPAPRMPVVLTGTPAPLGTDGTLSGIAKRIVPGPWTIAPLGIEGDAQGDLKPGIGRGPRVPTAIALCSATSIKRGLSERRMIAAITFNRWSRA